MLNVRSAAVIDFESLNIKRRPDYPPTPVGVALSVPGKRSKYLAWGHHEGNNCSWADARQALGETIDSGRPLIFHNEKFDIEVMCEHLAVDPPPWEQCHDTLPMLFLLNPRAPTYALKPSAEHILGQAPEERDAVIDWLIEHQPVRGVKLSDNPRGKHYAGAYVAWCPPLIAGPYAIGDVDRTRGLARYAMRELKLRGMLEAYELERELIFYLMDMERQGVRVTLRKLRKDVALYEDTLVRLDKWLHKKMRVGADFNINSGAQLADALITCGAATRSSLGVTETGKVQTNKEALAHGVTDTRLLAALHYRGKLCTCLRTFMKPWLEVAERSGGYIFTTWHSTRTDRGEGGPGTRTGRLSSTPNFQNLAKQFAFLFRLLDARGKVTAREWRALAVPLWKDMPPLPFVRSYVRTYQAGDVLVNRDHSQQELRILAHFEGGAMRDAYLADPWLDHHANAQKLINRMLNANFERKPIKNTGFALIYGVGLGLLAQMIDGTVQDAKKIKAAYLSIFPGLKKMYAEMKRRAAANEPIHTWGGREYYCEPPQLIHGRLQTYDYKMPNVLVQGSAADCLKLALVRYYRAKPRHHRLILNVHDELMVSVPRAERDEAMEQLKVAMESVQFDVPMLSEGSWSASSWDKLKVYDKKGKRRAR